jgi:hypothetical protein
MELKETDRANGFANRFLFVCVRRSKELPFGGEQLGEHVIDAFVDRLATAAATARKRGAIGMTDEAREMWVRVYARLSEGHMGLLGAVTARAEAQCLRLALIYALLDGADAIHAPHLCAALAVWEYCEASARFIFGSAVGNPVADEILRGLRAAGPLGMTRTQIRDMFKRHASGDQIGAALEVLSSREFARQERDNTGGRPVEIWRAR